MAILKIESLPFGLLYIDRDHQFQFIEKIIGANGVDSYSRAAITINLANDIKLKEFYCIKILGQHQVDIILLSQDGCLYKITVSKNQIKTHQKFRCNKLSLPNSVKKVNTFIVNIEVGFMIMIDDEGNLFSSGNNTYGQLGIGLGKPMNCITWQQAKLSNNVKAEKLIMTVGKTLGVLDQNKGLWLCGYGKDGQLGNGKLLFNNRDGTPTLKKPDSLRVNITQAQALTDYTIALSDKGRLYLSGKYSLSSPRHSSTKFLPVNLLSVTTKVVDIICSDACIFILDEKGALYYGDHIIEMPIELIHPPLSVTALHHKGDICIFVTQDETYWICRKQTGNTGKEYFNFNKRQQLQACTNVLISGSSGPRQAPEITPQGPIQSSHPLSQQAVFGLSGIGEDQL